METCSLWKDRVSIQIRGLGYPQKNLLAFASHLLSPTARERGSEPTIIVKTRWEWLRIGLQLLGRYDSWQVKAEPIMSASKFRSLCAGALPAACKRKPATPANHGLGKIRYLIGLSRILCPLSTRGARVIQVLASNFLLDLQLCAFQPPAILLAWVSSMSLWLSTTLHML